MHTYSCTEAKGKDKGKTQRSAMQCNVVWCCAATNTHTLKQAKQTQNITYCTIINSCAGSINCPPLSHASSCATYGLTAPQNTCKPLPPNSNPTHHSLKGKWRQWRLVQTKFADESCQITVKEVRCYHYCALHKHIKPFSPQHITNRRRMIRG
jgi:hypothetical protein